MNLLYLTFQEDAPLYLGVKRKIQGQSAAFQKLGYAVTYTMWHDRTFSFYGVHPGDKQIGGGPKMKQFFQIAREHVISNRYEILYLRLDRISQNVIHLCRTARENGTKKILIEIPNYPYLKDYIRNIRYAKGLRAQLVTAAKIAVNAIDDRCSGFQLKGLVDGAVLYGNHAEKFFGIPAVNADNGIDTDAIPLVHPHTDSQKIILLGVAGTLWWQGYDRILRGMKEYKEISGNNKKQIQFIMVGGDKTEMPAFLTLVKQLGLENDVVCPGFQTGQVLNATYQRADLGISSLGCYRRGITRCSSLKAREYAAAGLPFLYAYDDDSLTGKELFALRISNDDTSVNMDKLVNFIEQCRANSELVDKEREFAQKNYDWKVIMENVFNAFHMECTGTNVSHEKL